MHRILFQWKGFVFYSYPVFLGLGLVAGVFAGNVAAHSAGINAYHAWIATLLLIISALIGARILFVASHWKNFKGNLRRIWDRNDGGAGQHGGLALAVPLSIPLIAALHLPFGAFWDVSAFTILVGMIFTRFGCLLNGCCAGRPTTLWGIHLPNHRGIWEKRVPTQCLEALWAALLLFTAIEIWHWLPFQGALFLVVLGGYGAGRFVLESARERQPGASSFTIDHAISIVMVTISVAVLTFRWPK